MIGPTCEKVCYHGSCWDIDSPYLYQWVPVITVEPVSPELREAHNLSPDARLAVVERFEGKVSVCCTDMEARQGIVKAARAWAEACGAAYDWAAAA